jgi:hypothetical protein
MATLVEFVDEYLSQHEASPVTLKKLGLLLDRAVAAFGDYRLDELDPVEIAAWRMTIRPGYRFEATQALRQVLGRAVVWGLLDVNPAKQGVENPQRRRSEKRPFESWEEIEAVVKRLEPRQAAMVVFAARPGCALESGSRSNTATSTEACGSPTSTDPSAKADSRSRRRRQAGALCRCKQGRSRRSTSSRTGCRPTCSSLPTAVATSTCTTSATATGSPPNSQQESSPSGASTISGTFATFALRAGISTFELSRFMGASLTMIDRHYGHLARDGREHAIRLLDSLDLPPVDVRGRPVDADVLELRHPGQPKPALSRQ